MTVPPDMDVPVGLETDNADVVEALKDSYRTLSTGLNGVFLTHYLEPPLQFIPKLTGETTAGEFNCSEQFAYVYRQGTIVDYWFQVRWSSQSGATGTLQMSIPYLPDKGDNTFAFRGMGILDSMSYGAGYTQTDCALFPDRTSIVFGVFGSGVTGGSISVKNSGKIHGHLRYKGRFNE